MAFPRLGPVRRPGSVGRRWVPQAKTPPTISRVAVGREFPPDKLACRIDAPNGAIGRWAEDEPLAENSLGAITLSDEMPGGNKDAGGVLARDPRLQFPDTEVFGKVKFYQPGVDEVWGGYLDKAPDVSGDQMSISPACVGNQKHLEGNNAIKLGIIDTDQTKWGDSSLQRRLNSTVAGYPLVVSPSQGFAEASSTAAGIIFDFTNTAGVEGRNETAEACYSGEGIDIGKLLASFKPMAGGEDTRWDCLQRLGVDDVISTYVDGVDQNFTANLNQIALSSPAAGYKYAFLISCWTGAGTWDAFTNVMAWLSPKVMGRHGMEPRGTWPEIGFSDKQILEHAIPLHASPLEVRSENIEDSGFTIPQAWYPEGNMGDALKDIVKYGLLDWFVYDGLEFEYRWPGTYGRKWKAYVGESGLDELGEDSSRLWESVVVAYTDVDGSTKTVGPAGSGATFTDERLRITDPEHPAVKAKLTRRDILDLRGLGTPETAVAVGVRFLEEANLLNRSGSATLSGYVLDEYGIMWPAAQVKSGDWISFVDASDTSYRKIVGKNYAHDSRGAQIDIDAPPSGLEALLERLQAVLTPLGIA